MGQQLLLFDSSLFRNEVFNRYLYEHEFDVIENAQEIYTWVVNWNKGVKGNKKQKETALEQSFNSEFFGKHLGYVMYPGKDGICTAWPKPRSQVTGLSKEPDLILGHFNENENKYEPLVVVELKKPGAALDAIQPGYDNKTPVEQAFEYAEKLPSCRWVVVSDMLKIRIYSVDDLTRYYSFNLRDCFSAPKGELTKEFRKIYSLLSADVLIVGSDDSKVARLYRTSKSVQHSFQEGFYEIYTYIRYDIINEIQAWVESTGNNVTRADVVAAAQRLLDRMMFIYYCEDHPDRLLPAGLVKGVCDSAIHMPGNSTAKVYNTLKKLFRDIDVGVDTGHWKIPRYNGELFKEHPILEMLELPDSLHTKQYKAQKAKFKPVKGAWGLHEYDFWAELDKDLLGNIFERSLSDLAILSEDTRSLSIAESLQDQKMWGVFYTTGKLARFMADSVVSATIRQSKEVGNCYKRVEKSKDAVELQKAISELLEKLKSFKIVDLACGSGVFLTAALESLIRKYRNGLEKGSEQMSPIDYFLAKSRQSELLSSSIFGVDLFPQAVELAKLALWLAAAKKDEITSDLSTNIIAGDSLSPTIRTDLKEICNDGFDMVIGNPPWGSNYKPEFAAAIVNDAGLDPTITWDSWEIFLLLATSMLKSGGRINLVLPDTIHSAEKWRIREFLIKNFELEYFYNLGPDWFGTTIRMGTVIFQGVKKRPSIGTFYNGMVLSGNYRKNALTDTTPLRQIEAQIASPVLQERSTQHPNFEIRPFCSETDYKLADHLDGRSEPLSAICERARGEEMNANGLFWRCPNCSGYTVPGKKMKGGTYADKQCPFCYLDLVSTEIHELFVVNDTKKENYNEPYISGLELTHRYQKPEKKWIRTNLNPVL